MKYKVGDKVRIRKDLKIGSVYGTCCVTLEMHNLGGAIVRIVEANEYSGEYRIDSFGCYWTDEMFEEVRNMNKHVVIYVDGNKVVARCGDKEGVARCDDKKGIARCHPDDDFDFYTGAKIALERLEEAEKPYGWLEEGVTYHYPVPVVSSLYYSATYRANDWDKLCMERGIVFKTPEEAIECAKKMLEVVKQED